MPLAAVIVVGLALAPALGASTRYSYGQISGGGGGQSFKARVYEY